MGELLHIAAGQLAGVGATGEGDGVEPLRVPPTSMPTVVNIAMA